MECTFPVQCERGSSGGATQAARTPLAQSRILGTEAASPLWHCQSCHLASICSPVLQAKVPMDTAELIMSLSRNLLSSSLALRDSVVLRKHADVQHGILEAGCTTMS